MLNYKITGTVRAGPLDAFSRPPRIPVMREETLVSVWTADFFSLHIFCMYSACTLHQCIPNDNMAELAVLDKKYMDR